MTIEAGLLCAAIGCMLGVAGFIGGQKTAAKGDGERWGKLEATLQYMQDDLKEIKITSAENAKSTKESFRRVHERIDIHLRDDHGFAVPKQKE